MSDKLKHECGIALIRLLKPLKYYQEKYGTPLYGFDKLFLLMEKQHNRGQDGAGIGSVKLNVEPGKNYMARARSAKVNSLSHIFSTQLEDYQKKVKDGIIHPEFIETVKDNFDYCAELLIGHLRYGTSGRYEKETCHPFIRKSTWPGRNLMLVGNFNITNSDKLNARLVERGIHPVFTTDTQAILEEISYHLDIEHAEVYRKLRDKGLSGENVFSSMCSEMDPIKVIRNAASDWDGGYTIAGVLGNGDAFILRDANGIRPCFYIQNDEVIAFASERVALMTIFECKESDVKELDPASIFVIKGDGTVKKELYREPKDKTSCSFERLYFSRGNDPQIYTERKNLGAALCPQIFEAVNRDFKNSVFSFIPNTAETAYYGMMHQLRMIRRNQVKNEFMNLINLGQKITEQEIDSLIMDNWPRGEKIAHKDIKLRTFISNEKDRMKLASHVYDITYGVVEPADTLVCVDDSIVRGTTLKQQILRILSYTNPKKIVIASTAPQVRYPDCYGIDMSEIGKFIAFQAIVSLCKEKGKNDIFKEVYQLCVNQSKKDPDLYENYVKKIYDEFSEDQITKRIGEMVYPQNIKWNGEVQIVYQRIKDFNDAIPSSRGDWYFTGNYPTKGGFKVLNQAYINYYEKKEGRSY